MVLSKPSWIFGFADSVLTHVEGCAWSFGFRNEMIDVSHQILKIVIAKVLVACDTCIHMTHCRYSFDNKVPLSLFVLHLTCGFSAEELLYKRFLVRSCFYWSERSKIRTRGLTSIACWAYRGAWLTNLNLAFAGLFASSVDPNSPILAS
jgi:hypothetical protein